MHNHAPLAPQTIDARRRYLCRHIFTGGHRCASPALRGHDFCYHHRAARPPMPLASRTGMFTMPRIDDRAAIQIALFEVLSRISAGDIDLKRAGSILYGLQIASSNLPRAAACTPDIPAGAPLVEEIVRDFHLGDLAPILELPPAAGCPIHRGSIAMSGIEPPAPGAPHLDIETSENAATDSPSSRAEVTQRGTEVEGPPHLSIDVIQSEVPPCGISGTPQSKACPERGGAESDGDPGSASMAHTAHPIPTAATGQPAERTTDDAIPDGPVPDDLEATLAFIATLKPGRVPTPPSCFTRSPEIIASHAAERARIAEEIHSAVRHTRPPLGPASNLEP